MSAQQDLQVQKEAAARFGRTDPFGVRALQADRIEDLLAGAFAQGVQVFQADLAGLPGALAAAERQVGEWLQLPRLATRKRGVLLDQLTNELFERSPAKSYLFLLRNVPVERSHSEVWDEILEYFVEAAEFWRQIGTPFRCFHSSASPRCPEALATALSLVSPFTMGLATPGAARRLSAVPRLHREKVERQ